MKILAIVAMLFGAAVGLGELAFVKYFAGEERAAGEVFNTNDSTAAIDIQISEDDLPVRVNLRAYGWIDSNPIQPIGYVKIANGIGGDGNQIDFHMGIRKENNLSASHIGFGNVKFGPSSHKNLAQASRLFEHATPGKWSLSVTPQEENDYQFEKITAKVIVNSRAINWYVAGPGLFFMLGGMVMLIAIVKSQA